MNKMPL